MTSTAEEGRVTTIDLRSALDAACEKLIASGAIEKTIEEAIAKTVANCVATSLGQYSEFGKQVNAAVTKALVIDGDLCLPTYNDSIIKVIRAQVEHRTNAVIQQQVVAQVGELLQTAPAEITLTALADAFVEHCANSALYGVDYGDQEAHIDVRDGDRFTSSIGEGFKYIELSAAQPTVDKYSPLTRKPDITIGVHKGEVFSLQFKDRNVGEEMFVGSIRGFERMLFQMKAARTKVIFDVAASSIDTSYVNREGE